MLSNDLSIRLISILFIIDGVSSELHLSPFAVWNQTGITIAGWSNQTSGSAPSQLNEPIDISISSNDVLYIADKNNDRIVVVHLNSTDRSSEIRSEYDSDQNQFNEPWGIFVTNTSLYVSNYGSHQVLNLPVGGTNLTSILTLNQLYAPTFLYVDQNDNLYISLTFNHTILLFCSKITSGAIIAGTGIEGSNNNQFNKPNGIFVDDAGTIYVADGHNHRIMKWLADAKFGIIVAGNGTAGSSSRQLDNPKQIIVDENGYMYIIESNNGRITRWAPNSTFGICIVACTGTLGTNSTQLKNPQSLAFDSNGSLYVSDWGNHRVQKFQILNYHLSYNLQKISVNTTWDMCGITLNYVNLGELLPRGIFVDHNNTIYLADYMHDHILVWSMKNTNSIKSLIAKLYEYTALFVTSNGDIYYENGNKTGRIEKWSQNSINSTFVVSFSGNCHGLFIDLSNNLYCSLYHQHQVAKISLDDSTITQMIVAGTDSAGIESNMLAHPWGIFVDTKFNLYVADSANNRIQKFLSEQSDGLTVAGNATPNDLTLSHPTDVILDLDEFLYIVDNDGHRIIRSGHGNFECIAGCRGQPGSSSNEFNKPYALRFDSYGNIYVADEFNKRIQKFALSHNSCEISTTTVSTMEHTLSDSLSSSQKPDQQTTAVVTVPPPSSNSPVFVARKCLNSTNIGSNCKTSGTLCDLLKPCKNDGTCQNTMDTKGYHCSCALGFHGINCDSDHRLCKENTCWNGGTCNPISNTNFTCACLSGWEGQHCEKMINYCGNITCQNNGICRPLFLNYSCQCLIGSYSGRHCEITEKRIVIYKIVSTSLAWIAILAMTVVAMFVIIMDILKYCFGIDPVHEERERLRREKRAKKRKPIRQKFVYVDAPSSTEQPVSAMEDTTV